jgi:hypothetical protein
MHNTEGAEKAWFKYYQEKILIHRINLQWKRYCNFDIAAGTSIIDKATDVAWCDGDLSQIDAIKISVELYAENKIIANKQNAAQSGVKQLANLTHVFKIIKKNNTHTQLGTYRRTDAQLNKSFVICFILRPCHS